MEKGRRLPVWLKMQRASGENYSRVKQITLRNKLNTICTSGNCPNIGECWNAGTATFMILGDTCTRACKFCATKTGRPLPPDPDEPSRLAASVGALGLKHSVITSVDRDDLADGGAAAWAETVRTVRGANPGITVETLIPDFDGRPGLIKMVIESGPDIVSHNLETVRRLTPFIRTKARYDRSLDVLRIIAGNRVVTKSGIMVGLGETVEEVYKTIDDIRDTGCKVITIGQYLKPAAGFMEPEEYIEPAMFKVYREYALKIGFDMAECSPLVRSSFHAERHVG